LNQEGLILYKGLDTHTHKHLSYIYSNTPVMFTAYNKYKHIQTNTNTHFSYAIPLPTYIHTYFHTHTHIHIYIYTHTHIYICVCVCVWERERGGRIERQFDNRFRGMFCCCWLLFQNCAASSMRPWNKPVPIHFMHKFE
jgi:hypothetical protein